MSPGFTVGGDFDKIECEWTCMSGGSRQMAEGLAAEMFARVPQRLPFNPVIEVRSDSYTNSKGATVFNPVAHIVGWTDGDEIAWLDDDDGDDVLN